MSVERMVSDGQFFLYVPGATLTEEDLHLFEYFGLRKHIKDALDIGAQVALSTAEKPVPPYAVAEDLLRVTMRYYPVHDETEGVFRMGRLWQRLLGISFARQSVLFWPWGHSDPAYVEASIWVYNRPLPAKKEE